MEESYHCVNCGDKFNPKSPGKVPRNCPYCNQPETVERVKSAQDYLDEVMSDMGSAEERSSGSRL